MDTEIKELEITDYNILQNIVSAKGCHLQIRKR